MSHRLRAGLTMAGCLWLAMAPAAGGQAPRDVPSRPPVKGCRWEKATGAAAGLAAWVQRCDFGVRRIDLRFVGASLAIQYSDGGGPEPLVDVLPMRPAETAVAAVRRTFLEKTPAALAARCVLAPYRGHKRPAGTSLYTFVPDAAYARQLKARANPNEVGDPPCGDWGEAPDGIQYFQVWTDSKAAAILFVRVGQDEPLFDEMTMRLVPAGR